MTTVLSGFSQFSYSADGRIFFEGSIVEATCRFTNQLHVQMQNTPAESFAKPGDSGKTVPFSIQLTECPEINKTASVKFQAIPNPENPQLIQTSGTAEGVAIELIDAVNQQRLALQGGETNASSLTALKSNLTNSLNFEARYVSTSPKVKAGSASGFADFVITYY
jgi:major type 1 subunit fimbrin (pilin)